MLDGTNSDRALELRNSPVSSRGRNEFIGLKAVSTRQGIVCYACLIAAALAMVIVACARVTIGTAEAPRNERVYRVGFLGGGARFPWHDELGRGLAELGYIEGKNLLMEYRYAGGEQEQFLPLAQELVNAGVDVIVATDSATALAAHAANENMPVVVAVAGNPVASGLAETMARPGGKITGMAASWPELSAKRLELVVEILANQAHRQDSFQSETDHSLTAGVIFNPENPGNVADFETTVASAKSVRADLRVLPFPNRQVCDLPTALNEAVQEKVQMLILLDTPGLAQYRTWVARLPVQYGLPTLHSRIELVEAGGFISYTVSLAALYRRSATFVDKILKGSSPGDIPFEQPNVPELTINLDAARTLGITLPPSLVRRADRLVEATVEASNEESRVPAC